LSSTCDLVFDFDSSLLRVAFGDAEPGDLTVIDAFMFAFPVRLNAKDIDCRTESKVVIFLGSAPTGPAAAEVADGGFDASRRSAYFLRTASLEACEGMAQISSVEATMIMMPAHITKTHPWVVLYTLPMIRPERIKLKTFAAAIQPTLRTMNFVFS
jgi:hypothetical protein